MGSERDSTGKEVLGEDPSIGSYGPTQGGRSIFGQVVGGWAHLCHPCKVNHTHARRYPSGKKNKGRDDGLSIQKKERLSMKLENF